MEHFDLSRIKRIQIHCLWLRHFESESSNIQALYEYLCQSGLKIVDIVGSAVLYRSTGNRIVQSIQGMERCEIVGEYDKIQI